MRLQSKAKLDMIKITLRNRKKMGIVYEEKMKPIESVRV